MNNDNNDNVENNITPDNNDSVINPLLNLSTPGESNTEPEKPIDDILGNVNVDVSNNDEVKQSPTPNIDLNPNSVMPGLDNTNQVSTMPGLDNDPLSSTMPGLEDVNSVPENNNINVDTQSNIPGSEFDNGFLPGLNDNMNNDVMNGFDNLSAQGPVDMNQGDIDFNQVPLDTVEPTPDFNNVQAGMDQSQNFDNVEPDMNQAQSFDNMQPDMNQAQYGVNPNAYAEPQYATDYNEGFLQTWMGSELYQKSTTNKFNWCAAIFGPAYLFFRKMYLTAALAFMIEAIVSLICSLLNAPIVVTLIVGLVIYLVYFVGLGIGFYPIYKSYIQKQLEKYKKQVPDNNQLLNIANQKGGTSILAVIIFLVVSTLISSGIVGMSLSGNNSKTPSTSNTNTTNQVQTQKVTEVFNFADSYFITYDTSTWFLDENQKMLEKGDYKLAYATSYQQAALGVDLSTSDGRATILKQLVDQFTSLATQASLQVSNTGNSFISQNNCYYTYMDISSDTATSRYYFIILPEDKVLFQFALGIEDTAIAYETHMETITMLTQIDKDEDFLEENNVEGNNTTNETSNNVVSNETSNNVTGNETTNNTNTPSPRPIQTSNQTTNQT